MSYDTMESRDKTKSRDAKANHQHPFFDIRYLSVSYWNIGTGLVHQTFINNLLRQIFEHQNSDKWNFPKIRKFSKIQIFIPGYNSKIQIQHVIWSLARDKHSYDLRHMTLWHMCVTWVQHEFFQHFRLKYPNYINPKIQI